MFKKDSDIEYLLGSKQPSTLPTKPFDSLVCEFLEIFSKKLNLISKSVNYNFFCLLTIFNPRIMNAFLCNFSVI